MDAILDTPISALLEDMPVSDEIREALLDKGGQFRDVYEIVSNYENGAWEPMLEAVGRSRVNEEAVPELFLKSLDWANQVMSAN
jgi:EAL and modified HD-GYP domain-containing signal transduction protein